jgi:hypothetical protein
MRKLIFTFVAICMATTLSAQTTAKEWLNQLEESMDERYAYTLTVVVEASDSESVLAGSVMVEGDSYYMSLEAMEVYSNGKLRYEVNNERKEVTEDRVDLTSHDLLTNPTRAFKFAPEEFKMTLKFSQNDEIARIDLTPRDKDYGITAILLYLVREGDKVYPKQIAYDYDGDKVVVTLAEYGDKAWKLPVWNKGNYKAYDIVSFL